MTAARITARQIIPRAPAIYDAGDQEAARSAISRALDDLARPASPSEYTTGTSPGTRDVSTITTTSEAIDVLHTLIDDLKSKGVIA